jgi:acyl-CoA thioester hydrolase
MNVQFYAARFDEASWQFLGMLGLSHATLKQQDRSFVALEQRTHHIKEVLSGALLHITTELVKIGRSSLRFVHRMFDSVTDEEVAVSEIVAVHFDTARRVSVVLPRTVTTRAGEMLLVPLSQNVLAMALEPVTFEPVTA